MIEVNIDGKKIKVEEGETILSAAEALGIKIPTLCAHSAVRPMKACRVCGVEVIRGDKTNILTACNFKIKEPLSVKTKSDEALGRRKEVISEFLKSSPGAEPVVEMANDVGLNAKVKDGGERCIRCGLCVRACKELIGKEALTYEKDKTGTPYQTVNDNCIGCGTCAIICPTGAITVEDKKDTRVFLDGKKTFKLVRCKVCGEVITTEDHLNYLKEKKKLPDGIYEECTQCKRASYSKKVASGESVSLST
jgi:NADH dehydrogenase/NADH:ubiquinone oxidoreductase subunit G